MAPGDDLDEAHLLLDEAAQNVVQHFVGRQRILVLLPLAQFGGGRLGQDVLRDHLTGRSFGSFRPPTVAELAEPVDLHLVEVLDRVEATVHVAVERGVADAHLALVAGGHHHRAELVRDGHEDRAARAALQVFLGDVAGPVAEDRLERGLETFHGRSDRNDFVRNAKRTGTVEGVRQRLLRGEAVGHHEASHPLGAQRVGGHRRADRGVDAARQAEHNTGETVLFDIVAQAEHAGRVIGLLAFLDDLAGSVDAGPSVAALAPLRDRQRFPESRQLRRQRRIRIEREGSALEYQFVLPAHLVHVDQRQAAFDHAGHGHPHALIAHAAPIGRPVRGDQELRPRLRQALHHVRTPNVLADGQADAHAAESHRAGHGAGFENALLVEDAVIGQVDLEPDGLDPAGVEQGASIVDLATLDPGQADQHGGAAIRGRDRQFVAGAAAGVLEGGLENQILRRIGRQEKFGEDHHIRALRRGLGPRARSKGGVRGRIADDWIELGDGDAQGGGHGAGLKRRSAQGNGPACPHPRLPAARPFKRAAQGLRQPQMRTRRT